MSIKSFVCGMFCGTVIALSAIATCKPVYQTGYDAGYEIGFSQCRNGLLIERSEAYDSAQVFEFHEL